MELSKLRTVLIVVIAGMALAIANTPTADAGNRASILAKPPSGPTATPAPLDGGTIYYYERGTTNEVVREIAPDGTGDRDLAGVSSVNLPQPSRALHNGQRWFVEARDTGGGGSFFPNGRRREDVFVLYEGMASALQLTDNGSQCIAMNVEGLVHAIFAPSASGQVDGAVSWLGEKWADAGDGGSPCDTPAGVGIYRAALTFDGSGNISGIASQPTSPEFNIGSGPYAAYFTWNPNGQQVAHTGNLQLVVLPGSGTPLNGGKYAVYPVWSPSGAKIAFHGAVDSVGGPFATYTINPDGSGLAMVAQGRRAKNSGQTNLRHHNVAWSPTGTHLVFTENETPYNLNGFPFARVRRMTATGGNNVVLPTSLGLYGSFSIGWVGN